MSKEMSWIGSLAIVCGAAAIACAGADSPPSPEGEPTSRGRPNILIIVADDLGYSDIGWFGGEIELRTSMRWRPRGSR